MAKQPKPQAKKPAKPAWRPFADAAAWVSQQGLNTPQEWKQFCLDGKCPADIPPEPRKVYKEWLNYDVWLGTKLRKKPVTVSVDDILSDAVDVDALMTDTTTPDSLEAVGPVETTPIVNLVRMLFMYSERSAARNIMRFFMVEVAREDIKKAIDHYAGQMFMHRCYEVESDTVERLIWLLPQVSGGKCSSNVELFNNQFIVADVNSLFACMDANYIRLELG